MPQGSHLDHGQRLVEPSADATKSIGANAGAGCATTTGQSPVQEGTDDHHARLKTPLLSAKAVGAPKL